jgi:hypothetical protein
VIEELTAVALREATPVYFVITSGQLKEMISWICRPFIEVRNRLISRRTAVINQLRAFPLERGLVFAKTPSKLRAAMPISSRTQMRT